jgi:hypothetical protein
MSSSSTPLIQTRIERDEYTGPNGAWFVLTSKDGSTWSRLEVPFTSSAGAGEVAQAIRLASHGVARCTGVPAEDTYVCERGHLHLCDDPAEACR